MKSSPHTWPHLTMTHRPLRIIDLEPHRVEFNDLCTIVKKIAS